MFKEAGPHFAKVIEQAVGRGIFDIEAIIQELRFAGYQEYIIAELSLAADLFDYSKQMLSESKIPFIWTAQNEINYGMMLEAKRVMLLDTGMRRFAAEMSDYAINVKLSGKPSKQIIAEMSERFAREGRRIGTEVDTALSTFDRASKKMLYENAGIGKFVYFGPLDDVTRDICRAAMTSPKQQTGWTETDIASSEVDFITGGGYNCRHDWLPFVKVE